MAEELQALFGFICDEGEDDRRTRLDLDSLGTKLPRILRRHETFQLPRRSLIQDSNLLPIHLQC